MGCDTVVEDAFDDFRDKVEVRDGTLAGEVLGWEVIFLEERCDKGVFERGWEIVFGYGKIDKSGDGKKQGR